MEPGRYNAELIPDVQSQPEFYNSFCFNANYFRALLGYGYKMNATGASAPTFVNVKGQVDGADLSVRYSHCYNIITVVVATLKILTLCLFFVQTHFDSMLLELRFTSLTTYRGQ